MHTDQTDQQLRKEKISVTDVLKVIVIEPPKVDANGYIENKVDYIASLSEDENQSWCDDISDSEQGDQDEQYYEEEEKKGEIIINQSLESLTKEVEKIEEEVCDNDGAKSNKSFSGENPRHRIICNLAQTEYDVIKKVARKVCNWRIKYFLEDTMGAIINYEGGQ